MYVPSGWLILAAIWIALASGACSEAVPPCPHPCPEGQVCDERTGRCVELRPPSTPPDVGRYASLAVESSGRTVVAAYAARYGDLVLGRERDDGNFEFEYVDGLPSTAESATLRGPLPQVRPGPDVGLYASLGLDALDRPHIAYFDRTHGTLKYAVRTGEGWRVETVAGAEGAGEEHLVGRGASLALDKDGLAHIAYLDEGPGAVMLARKTESQDWRIERVTVCEPDQGWSGPSGGALGRPVSLVLDNKGGEWIAFFDVCTSSLNVASRAPDGWSILRLAAGPGAGTWVSAALDADGNVALAYHHRGRGTLRYAWNEGGAMKTLEVDPGRVTGESGAERSWPVGQHCALAFGHDGLGRIAYLDGRTLDLKLVTVAPGGVFDQPVVLAADGPVGFFNAAVRAPSDIRLASFRMGRDAEGASDGALLFFRVPSGVSRTRGGR